MADHYTDREQQHISELMEKIMGLIDGYSRDEITSALGNVYIALMADVCPTCRNEIARCLTLDVRSMLEEATRRAPGHRCLH
jgi:hypothetical protein